MTTEIRLRDVSWGEPKYSCYDAFIGAKRVGGVSYSMTRNDPTPWIASFELFGREWRRGFANRDDAQASFPRALQEAMRSFLYLAETGDPE